MFGIDDLFLGIVASGIITLADRHDKQLDDEQQRELAELRERAGRLRTPDDGRDTVLAVQIYPPWTRCAAVPGMRGERVNAWSKGWGNRARGHEGTKTRFGQTWRLV